MSTMHNILIIDDQAEDCKDIERAIRKVYDSGEVRIFVAYSYLEAQSIIYNPNISITVMFIDVNFSLPEITFQKKDMALEELLKLVVRNNVFHKKAMEDMNNIGKLGAAELAFTLDFLGDFDRNPNGIKRSGSFHGTPAIEFKRYSEYPYRIFAKLGNPKGLIYRVYARHPKNWEKDLKMWFHQHIKE